MRKRLWAMALAACVSLSGASADVPMPARITELVSQLGSPRFAVREQAAKELDKIGEPALAALKKASSSSDMETANRASKLHEAISQRIESVALLAPKVVELSLKEVTITDAVAELAKQSGYKLKLVGDATKMSERKVSLETGKVPYFTALTMLCDKAGLSETDDILGVTVNQPVLPRGTKPVPVPLPAEVPEEGIPVPLPPVRVKPLPQRLPPQAAPPQVLPNVPAVQPVKPLPRPQVQPLPAPIAPAILEVPPAILQVAPAIIVVDPVAPVQVEEKAPAPVQIQPAQPVQIQIQIAPNGPIQAVPLPAPIGRVPVVRGGVLNGEVTLIERERKAIPTHIEGAVRIQALPVDKAQQYAPPRANELPIALYTTVEPRLQVAQIVGVRIDKAIDDRGQELVASTDMNDVGAQPINIINGQNGGIIIGNARTTIAMPNRNMSSVTPVRLKAGKESANSITQLTGIMTLKLRSAADVLARIDAPQKVTDPVTVTKNDVTLKVMKATETETGWAIDLELIHSNETLAEAATRQVADAAKPTAVRYIANYGLALVDAEGKPYPIKIVQNLRRTYNAGYTTRGTIEFTVPKDATPSALVFRGTRVNTVDVPFTLKDVPVK